MFLTIVLWIGVVLTTIFNLLSFVGMVLSTEAVAVALAPMPLANIVLAVIAVMYHHAYPQS